MSTIFYTMILALLVCGALGFILQAAFYTRLRRQHTEVWQSLGSPSTFGGSFSVVGFLWQKKYQAFSDSQSVRLARWFRGVLVVFSVLFISTLVLFAATLWTVR